MPDPAATAPIPLALVGCGTIAASYLQALAHVPTLHFVAAIDPLDAARQAVATQHRVPAFATVEALSRAGPAVGAALVLVPPDRHESVTTELLAAGVHVLCEKPLAPTVAAAQRLLAAARSADRQLMLGSKFRYAADVRAARDLLQRDAIGEVLRFEIVFCSRVDMTRRWNGESARAGGGVLMDNGGHAVDLARCLLGPLTSVQATFAPRVQPLDVEDTVHLQMRTQRGALGTCDLSWSLQLPTTNFLSLHGRRGTIEIGWRQSRWRCNGADWQVLGGGFDKVAAFAAQLTDFATSCARAAAPQITPADALAAVVAVDTAYRSAAEQRWLDVPSISLP